MRIILLIVLILGANLLARDKHVLIRSNGAEVATLDPSLSDGIPSANILVDLNDFLYKLDRDGNIVKGLAKTHKVSKNGLIHTITLKKAYWSDGKMITAQQYVDSYRRSIDPKTGSTYAWYFGAMGLKNAEAIIQGKMSPKKLGIKAINSHTLQLTLSRPVSYINSMFVHPITLPERIDIIKKYGNSWTSPKHYVSTGPYMLKTWIVNDKIVLVKNPKYRNSKKLYFNKVIYLPIGGKVSYDRYEAGSVDISSGDVPVTYLRKIASRNTGEVKIYPIAGVYYYQFNLKKKKFQDVRVRKALSYALNRDIITKKVLSGRGLISAYGFIPHSFGYKSPDIKYAKMTQTQRDAEAVKLMKAAGYSASHPLKFDLLYNTSDTHKRVAVVMQGMWNRVFKGAVKVSILNEEWKTFLQSRNEKQYEVARGGWVGDYLDASTMLSQFTSNSGLNDPSYFNKKYDKYIKDASTIKDINKRNHIYQKNDLLIVRDVPVIPIYFETDTYLIKPYIKGLPTASTLGYIPSEFLYRK